MRIIIPTQLSKLTNGEPELVCLAPSIHGMISAVQLNYPLLAERLFDKEGNINKFLNVYVNDEDIRFLEGRNTKVGENDVVSIVPAIAGG
jgi:molybdopterin synthase sulfur carrier subunit